MMISLLYALMAGSTLFLSFLILTNPRKVNLKANRWLAFFIFCLFLMLLGEPMAGFDLYEKHPYLLGYDNLFIFLLAPSLYICVSLYTNPEKKFNKKEILHFIPNLLLYPFFIADIVFLSNKEKLEFIKKINEIQNPRLDIVSIFLILSMLIYTCFCYLKIRKHQRNIRLFTSDIGNINLNWLKNTILIIIVMVIIWILNIQFYNIKAIDLLCVAIYFVSIFTIGYFSIRQDEIYPYKAVYIQEIKEIISESPADQKIQRVSAEELGKLKAKVTYHMEVNKLFLDDTLSLPKLAESVETSVHNLSYILNAGFNENFFQFVNRYRVEEAKKLLNSEKIQQLSMVGIAFESGFSSKTTFNTTFKRITGISPTEFVSQKQKQIKTA